MQTKQCDGSPDSGPRVEVQPRNESDEASPRPPAQRAVVQQQAHVPSLPIQVSIFFFPTLDLFLVHEVD